MENLKIVEECLPFQWLALNPDLVMLGKCSTNDTHTPVKIHESLQNTAKVSRHIIKLLQEKQNSNDTKLSEWNGLESQWPVHA